MAKKKAYVVWSGRETGVFDAWAPVLAATRGFPGARQNGYATRAQAEAAFAAGDPDAGGAAPRTAAESAGLASRSAAPGGRPTGPATCVDAACDTTRWVMEYRGVDLQTGEVLFAEGPFTGANANFGEFLAIVDALRRPGGEERTLYSDSLTARAWVRKRALNSAFLRDGKAGSRVAARLEDALAWLKSQPSGAKPDIRVWDTRAWGEIPADFGRKG
ncbi:ribonuclease H family protein [Phycisphaera mikurensis]|uniref:Ribonuclease H n=1 Tax=Phycisphaera mikurensis (strain NBRC 102666 / KCTC 22515 / FYK2301M01) TaxID=1142394 RepID=I0IDY7_PHYMF|nr:ribonuclease H family protein [Phycisphaera mikurensis]MBB6441282.1 ribonuclease HI [Phycisphaera mikurensis]BAM03475.1 ribonuclease H [Phycisphaera mikurensis NBRC 102666]